MVFDFYKIIPLTSASTQKTRHFVGEFQIQRETSNVTDKRGENNDGDDVPRSAKNRREPEEDARSDLLSVLRFPFTHDVFLGENGS